MFSFLKVFLLELHNHSACTQLPYDPQLVDAFSTVLLQLPTRCDLTNPRDDGENPAILIPIIPRILQRSPFAGALSTQIVQCARDILARRTKTCDEKAALDVAFCSPQATEVDAFLSEAYEAHPSLVLYGCLNGPDWFRRRAFQYIIHHQLENELRETATDPKGERVFHDFVLYCVQKMDIERLLNCILDTEEVDLWEALRLIQLFGQVHKVTIGMVAIADLESLDSKAKYLHDLLKNVMQKKSADPRRREFLDIMSQFMSA